MDTPSHEPALTLFATPVRTPATMAAQVRAQLERRFADALPPEIDLDRVARQAVARFQTARVTAFVPVLALREASEAVTRLAAVRVDR